MNTYHDPQSWGKDNIVHPRQDHGHGCGGIEKGSKKTRNIGKKKKRESAWSRKGLGCSRSSVLTPQSPKLQEPRPQRPRHIRTWCKGYGREVLGHQVRGREGQGHEGHDCIIRCRVHYGRWTARGPRSRGKGAMLDRAKAAKANTERSQATTECATSFMATRAKALNTKATPIKATLYRVALTMAVRANAAPPSTLPKKITHAIPFSPLH